MLEMLTHLGHSASQARVLVQAPKPSSSILALGQESELADLGADEEHSRAVLAGSHAGSAADAGSSIHGLVGLLLGDGNGIGIGHAAGIDADVASSSHNLVEGTTVDHQVADDGETG